MPIYTRGEGPDRSFLYTEETPGQGWVLTAESDHVHTGWCNHGSCDVPVVPVVPFKQVAMEDFNRAWRELADAIGKIWDAYFGGISDFLSKMRDAGLIAADPGEEYDPREHAPQARRNRNTGPANPTGQSAHRPRRHQ